MTAQIDDLFHLNEIRYSLAGISEGSLFEPTIFNLRPSPASTACWRGYQAIFSMSFQSHLIIEELHVNLLNSCQTHEGLKGPAINEVSPSFRQERSNLFNNHYKKLNYKISYSGGLLIADGFKSELYVHMGFHQAWKYDTVIELIFEDGVLSKQVNRSAEMAEVRNKVLEMERSEKQRNKEQIREFVERSFDRSY